MSMFAVIESGGKQYHIQVGDVIKVEKLEANVGDSVNFDKILKSEKASRKPQKWTTPSKKILLSRRSLQRKIKTAYNELITFELSSR